MKYFEVTQGDGKGVQLFTKTAVRRFLAALPTLEGVRVYRYWWCRDDLVDTTEYAPADFLAKKAADLTSGATAQWAAPRGKL